MVHALAKEKMLFFFNATFGNSPTVIAPSRTLGTKFAAKSISASA
jgi:hypothetical protein